MSAVLGFLALIGIAAMVVAAAAVLLSRTRLSSDRRHGTSGSLAGALLHVQSLIEPGKKRVAEVVEKAAERAVEDPSGDPPSPPSGERAEPATRKLRSGKKSMR
jgi:hypothetical protein